MRNLYLAFFCSFLFIHNAAAQQHSTVIADSATHKILPGASVMISGKADTVLVTGDDGRFVLGRRPPGDYTLQVSYLGYPTHRTYFSIAPGNYGALPDTFYLSGKQGRDLKEVVIKNDAPAVSMNGDTTEYNADKFKVGENAVVEDLLKKLPGVHVQRDGTIKSKGETVNRVLVDGKEFFGGDPALATKNLPANMIKKVQVYDKKSDLAAFTGVDDGNTVKTINLVTKNGLKKGVFGNINAGAGNDERYEAGANINSFHGDKQLSLLAKANNVNKSGFSNNELLGVLMKTPNALSSLPPAALSELVKQRVPGLSDGLTNMHFGGLNFNYKIGKNTDWQSSYFYSGWNTKNNYSQDRQNFLADTAYNYAQSGFKTDGRREHRATFTLDSKIDRNNTLKITPRFNYSTGNGNEQKTFASHSPDGKTLLNEGVQALASNNTDSRVGADMFYGHKFTRYRRSLVFTLAPQYAGSDYISRNQSQSQYYNLGSRDSINQETTGHGSSTNINSKLTYTEPLGSKYSLQLSGQWQYDHNKSSRLVKDYDRQKQQYSQVNEQYSDVYRSTTYKYRPDVTLATKYKKLDITAGAAWEQNQLDGRSASKGYSVYKSAGVMLPHAYLQYKFNQRRKITLNYNTTVGMPGMSQLQPLDDNSNPLVTYRGNPGLDVERGQEVSLAWENSAKNLKRSQYLRLNFQQTSNRITDQWLIDATTARQLVYPVNVNGNYSGSLSMGANWQIGEEGSSVNIDLTGKYEKSKAYSNGQLTDTRTLSVKPELSYNQYIGEAFSLNFKGSYDLLNQQFSIQQNQPRRSANIYYSVTPLIKLPAGFSVEALWDNYITTGLADGFNTSVSLLSASFTKTLGKSFVVGVEGKDLLNQNKSVQRLSGNGYIEDRRSNLLGRYVMLSLTYKLRYFSK